MKEAPPVRRLKNRLKASFPEAAVRYLQWKERGSRLAARGRHLQDIFSRIHEGNLWGDPESLSGPGSSLEETAAIRRELPGLLRRLGVRSLLDAACGDGHWLRPTELGLDRYMGIDIVPDLIARNRRRLTGPGVEFAVGDVTRDPLPRVDLILCRDCLIHFSYHYIRRTLRNFASSGAAYLLTTTYSGLDANQEILSGQWRPIDLELPPFSLPPPEGLVCEKHCAWGGLRLRRSLGLWRLASLGSPHAGAGARRGPRHAAGHPGER